LTRCFMEMIDSMPHGDFMAILLAFAWVSHEAMRCFEKK
jgi:hypothetical protein